MQQVRVCLWFDREAEEAAQFYTSLIDDAEITAVQRYPEEGMPDVGPPQGRGGEVLTVEFSLAGQRFIGLNGGPGFPHTQAASIEITVEGQKEVDRLWEAVTAEGGVESQCGWCKDRFGVSWQIVPVELMQAISDPDPAAADAALQAMLRMKKIIIADLR